MVSETIPWTEGWSDRLPHPCLLLQGSCKVMAKDLVRTRRYISKFYSMRTQLQAVSLRLQTLRSNQQMAEAMKGATRVSGRSDWQHV